MLVYIYTHTYAYTYTSTRINMRIYDAVQTRWRTATETHKVCTNMHTHTYTHVYTCIRIHMHIHMHIHTCIHVSRFHKDRRKKKYMKLISDICLFLAAAKMEGNSQSYMTFSKALSKLKAHSSNVSFHWNVAKETFELWALSFEIAFENVTPSGIGCMWKKDQTKSSGERKW